jgi:hypothetical protein
MPPQRRTIINPSQMTMSEQVFGKDRTSPSVFDSGPEKVAKKVMRALGMDDPPDESSAVSAGADFANPLGIPGFGGVVRLGKNIAGAGLRDLRLSTGEMVRAVRELLEHGRFRAFHGTPDPGPLNLRGEPFHVGTIDAAMERAQSRGFPASRSLWGSANVPTGAQIFPVDVSFSGGLRGSRALHDPARPVIGRPTDPLTDSAANVLGEMAQDAQNFGNIGRLNRRPQIQQLTNTALNEKINQGIQELNRGNTEALLYQNMVENPGSLSLSILNPKSTNVKIGDPLDIGELFKQRQSLGLPPSPLSGDVTPLWKFKGR